jgi:hypothetical protein
MAQLRVWFLLGRFGDLFFLFPSIRHDAVVSVGVLVNAVDAKLHQYTRSISHFAIEDSEQLPLQSSLYERLLSPAPQWTRPWIRKT